MFQDRLAALEGAEACLATGTGMAAVFAALASQLNAGDRVVASRALFGACYAILKDILPRWGVITEFVDGTDLDAWERALATPAKVVFFESPSNPMLDIVDVRAVSEMAHAAGATVMIDNVFATPMSQHPLQLGADVVIYSATKHIDGQDVSWGRGAGGRIYQRANAEILSPDRTNNYPLQCLGHAEVAKRLGFVSTGRQAMRRVLQTGWKVTASSAMFAIPLASHPQHDLAMRQMENGGTLLAFTLHGDQATATTVLNSLQLVDISNNLGDSKTLAVSCLDHIAV